jgi:hypothetical protein
LKTGRYCVKKKVYISMALLASVVGFASAIQTAQIVSRVGAQAGIIGGYQSDSNFIGGLGGIFEMEFPLAKSLSVSVDGGGGYNLADGPLAGGGLDLKYRFLKYRQFDFSAIAYGRGFYQFAPAAPSYYFYGGGAVVLATMELDRFIVTLGGGACDEIYGSTDARKSNQLGPVGMASLCYRLSKKSDVGLACEYGGSRCFLGACMDFALGGSADGEPKNATKKAAPKTSKK